VIDAGGWGDDVRLSDLEPKFTMQRLRTPGRRYQAALREQAHGDRLRHAGVEERKDHHWGKRKLKRDR
jgi:hypothetical protein